ncbi:DUF4142 domain-containing protein [Nonomuraea sp. H19]|uniref:DUF4142 domain-containing protein n=1 Tax=Nonomuraea sp. H19 TaxID=3452206 RepID=UPI003F8BB3BE
MRTRLTMLLAVAALAGCANAPVNTAAVVPKTETQPSEPDKAWMKAIHEGNLAEVQAGRLAQDKGTGQRVKRIGKMLVQDHTKLDAQVTQTASKLGIQLPTSPSTEQRAEIDRLEDAKGKDFDREFLASMTKAHTAALSATKTEISDGTNPEVVALAKAAEPKLQEHLSALQEAHGE